MWCWSLLLLQESGWEGSRKVIEKSNAEVKLWEATQGQKIKKINPFLKALDKLRLVVITERFSCNYCSTSECTAGTPQMSWIEGISQERESWLKQWPCSYCRCESSSSTHSLRNTFPERKLSQSHVHLPQKCLSSCSRHPSSPLSTLQRGDHIHTDEDELDVLKPSLSTLFSCDFREDTVLAPKGGTPEKRPCLV